MSLVGHFEKKIKFKKSDDGLKCRPHRNQIVQMISAELRPNLCTFTEEI